LVILNILGVIGGIKYINHLEKSEPSYSGFNPPRDLQNIISWDTESTVTVLCGGEETYLSLGSGYVFDNEVIEENLSDEESALYSRYSVEIITNYHVVEPCFNSDQTYSVRYKDEILEAALWYVDEENDTAVILINEKLPTLVAQKSKPQAGWWVMAVGSPYGLDESVTFGNVINVQGDEVYSTAALSSGNSGGPLVDNEGYVIATNIGFRSDGQNFSIGKGLNVLCDGYLLCAERYWE